MAVLPTNFGRDTSCTTGVKPGRYVSGVRLVGEALYRRFTTQEGTLLGGPEEEVYGLDLTDMIGDTPANIKAAWPARIQNEALRDPRVRTAKATITVTTDTAGLVTASILLECDTEEGPFDLQLTVDEVSVTLLGITVPS